MPLLRNRKADRGGPEASLKDLWPGDFPPGVRAYFSEGMDFRLRDGQGHWTPEQENVLERSGVPVEHLCHLRQVHGADIRIADDGCSSVFLPEGDGLLTNREGLALAIRTADCLPVFLYDGVRRCCGIVHAGWQGSRKGIAAIAVKMMQKTWHCRPGEIWAVFGPAIGVCCYQVGPEFEEHFPGRLNLRGRRRYLDLRDVTRRQLTACGVLPDHMADPGRCTCCEEGLFSYRRQGHEAGRHLSVIFLNNA